MILRKQLRRLGAEKLASPDLVKSFSILILKLYATESKRLTFSRRITFLITPAPIKKIRIRALPIRPAEFH